MLGLTDERLRLLAPVLAAYIVQKDADKGSDGIFSDLCRSLSSDGETPWIRGTYIALAVESMLTIPISDVCVSGDGRLAGAGR